MTDSSKILKLYSPLFVFIILFISFFFINKSDTDFDLPFGLSKMFSLSFSIKSNLLFKVVYLAICLLSLSPYLFFDYSKFFPRHFSMEVFYDKEGIDTVLKLFNKYEMQQANIVDVGYELERERYYLSLDKELKRILNFKAFSIKDGIFHSTGDTSFIVEKINGFQKYRITESKGKLTHTLERPNSKADIFLTFFEKLSSKNDYMNASFRDIFINRNIVIKPLFKEIIAEQFNSTSVEFNHILHGVTKIYTFPIPNYSNTLYCIEIDEKLYPIGYAIYF